MWDAIGVLPRPVLAGLLSTEKCAVDMIVGMCSDGSFLYGLWVAVG